jgi:hypothetical protein
MTETLISPGVIARENDNSFVSQQPITVGAAIIGPTVKGPVEIPTVVTSYSDFVNKFGDVLTSGSDTYSYFTSIAAYNYFSNGGETLLVAKVVSGSYTSATSTDISSNIQGSGGTFSSVSFQFSSSYTASSTTGTNNGLLNLRIPTNVPSVFDDYYIQSFGFNTYVSTGQILYISASLASIPSYLSALCNRVAATPELSSIFSASFSGTTLTITGTTSGSALNGTIIRTGPTGSEFLFPGTTSDYAFTTTMSGGVDGISPVALVLETISEGVIMNSSSSLDSQGALASGSINNIRWQIVNSNTSSGTFGLLIRQGNDITNNPTILETWTNLS